MFRLLLTAVTLAFIVTGCSSDGDEKRQAYLDADYYTRLELPPDLTSPDDVRQMNIPAPSPKARQQFEEESEHVGKKSKTKQVPAPRIVAPKFDNMHIESADGVFWLEIDSAPEKVWPQLTAFWNNEGIQVLRHEPVLGFIETDWVSQYRENPDAGFFARLFNKIEPDKVDKFRMRIEKGSNNSTKVYITHSGREVFVEDNDINWLSRCSEPQLERELLRRLAVFLGFNNEQLDAMSDNYRPYAPRVRLSEDEVSDMFIIGDINVVWNRTLRAIDRLGFTRQQADESAHQINIAIGRLTTQQITEEKDEIAESSWLNKWVSGLGNDSPAGKHFALKLDKNEQEVKVTILDGKNNPAQSVYAEQLRTALARELR